VARCDPATGGRMTKCQAHALLDAAKAGVRISIPEITEALYVTGDIGYRSEPSALGFAVPQFSQDIV